MVAFDVPHIGNVIENVCSEQCEGYGAEAVHTPLIINSYLVAIILRCVFRLTDAAQVLVEFFHIGVASYFYYTSRGLRIQQNIMFNSVLWKTLLIMFNSKADRKAIDIST